MNSLSIDKFLRYNLCFQHDLYDFFIFSFQGTEFDWRHVQSEIEIHFILEGRILLSLCSLMYDQMLCSCCSDDTALLLCRCSTVTLLLLLLLCCYWWYCRCWTALSVLKLTLKLCYYHCYCCVAVTLLVLLLCSCFCSTTIILLILLSYCYSTAVLLLLYCYSQQLTYSSKLLRNNVKTLWQIRSLSLHIQKKETQRKSQLMEIGLRLKEVILRDAQFMIVSEKKAWHIELHNLYDDVFFRRRLVCLWHV